MLVVMATIIATAVPATGAAARLTLSRATTPPGTSVTASGTGFGARELVEFRFAGSVIAADATDGSGAFADVTIPIPASARPGPHTLVAVGDRSGFAARRPITISSPWAQPQYGARSRGFNPYENQVGIDNVAELELAWSAAVPFAHGVVVSNGLVFTVANTGNDEGELRAFRVGCATGGAVCSAAWTGEAETSLGSPAVVGGIVYVAGVTGTLFAFRASGCGAPTCAPLWRGTIPNGSFGSPVVAGGRVFVTVRTSQMILAFPARCGTSNALCDPIWHGPGSGLAASSTPAVADGVVYVGSNDGKLYAFSTTCATGGNACTPLWNAPTTNGLDSPSVAGGVVYVAGGDLTAYPVGCATGNAQCSPLWTGDINGVYNSTPAVARGTLFIGSGATNTLYAFPANCGRGGVVCAPTWTAPAAEQISSSPAVANGVVYIGSNDDWIYAYDTECGSGGTSCAPLWKYPTGGDVRSVIISDGTVYATSLEGRLRAFDLASGNAS